MYGNLQRVHIVQVDWWTEESPETGSSVLTVTVHRMAWKRQIDGTFESFSETANEYEIHLLTEAVYSFYSFMANHRERVPVYLNGFRSDWRTVGEELHQWAQWRQNSRSGGLSITNKVC